MLRLEHETAQANSEREVAKTELNMRTVEKIEVEERTKSLHAQHEQLKQQVIQQGEEFDKLIKDKQMLAFKADLERR